MHESFIPYRLASDYLSNLLKENDLPFPVVGVICGSGLSGLSKTLEGKTLTVPYSKIPGFPSKTTVQGHAGELVFGMLSGVPAICFRGRFHVYEGHDTKTTVLPVNVMRCLDVRVVIITNAAGGLNPDYNVGDVIAISDHLAIPNLAGNSSLVGPNDDELGPRFPSTSDAYPGNLRQVAVKAAKALDVSFLRSHGTYAFVVGPMYESKAECRFLRNLGADAVGMSTIPEVVVAHHCHMQVLCLSLITNKAVIDGDEGQAVANHAEVLGVATKRAGELQTLVQKVVEIMKEEVLPKLAPSRKISLIVPPPTTKDAKMDAKTSLGAILPTVIAACTLVGLGVFIGTRRR
mmetsp:Transcript_1182/g.1543  ORF Transcript_1182/g.1543 Transcript_1182/m.1543 type:complete len:347 (-) Transcript_1182:129-1169(-)|eukprot:CAMPEP_0198139436 /NCGR_PEP_ID=MMETSP1443-20131203/2725_1 /TAXON_ID=186043 /ORGANISM="Entomoneis sp., Strain CCMP2396" /LENGTH=346 /DNA_ID=CAMNT_0043801553 /DNA_START=132 /DNA_END=1172 /DNA_ORIENTATION=+